MLLVDTQNNDSEEECEEIISDKENAVDPKTVQLRAVAFPDVQRNLGAEEENVITKNCLQAVHHSCLGLLFGMEEGELTGLRGKERAYDSEGNRKLVPEPLNNILDKTVRKSQRVHTRAQNLNL